MSIIVPKCKNRSIATLSKLSVHHANGEGKGGGEEADNIRILLSLSHTHVLQ